MDETTRPYHPAANIFPLLQGDEYEQLKADIAANGQIEPITILPDGAIIDGRNRHRACLDLGIMPTFQTWRPQNGESLVGFVMSLNLHRRHLSSSQAAAVSIDALPLYEEEALQRMRAGINQHSSPSQIIDYPETGKAAALVARDFGTNRQYVADAKQIKEASPALFQQIKNGEMTIPQAKREINHANKVEPPPMAGKYGVIYADPPWAYNNSGFEQSAAQHYPTMTADELARLPVFELAASPCVLYLWATAPLLDEAIDLIRAWGFDYKTHRVWIKDRAPGMGWWLKTNHELLLIATKNGNAHPSERLLSVFEHPVGRHSAKPAEVRREIQEVHAGPYIELFARESAPGWHVWGNESNVQQ